MRSTVPVVVVLLALLVAGCVAGPSAPTGPATAESLPDPPSELTERTASNYTTATEAELIYDRYVKYNPTENRVSCRSDTRAALESAFVVAVQCTGGVELGNGEHIDVAASTHYYVTETTVERIGRGDSRSVRYREYRSNGPDLTSFAVVNLANDSVSMSVELARNESASPLRFDYEVEPHSSVSQVGLPFAYGTTREMRVETDEATTTARFTSERLEFDSPTVVYVLPGGRVRITVGPSEIR